MPTSPDYGRVQTDTFRIFALHPKKFRWQIRFPTRTRAMVLVGFDAPDREEPEFHFDTLKKRQQPPCEEPAKEMIADLEAACHGTHLSWSARVNKTVQNQVALDLFDPMRRLEFLTGRPLLRQQPGQSAEEANTQAVRGVGQVVRILAQGRADRGD